MPSGAEAVRAERAARRQQAIAAGERPPIADAGAGGGIVRSAWAGTAVFGVGTALAVVVPDFRIVMVFVDLALLFAGSAAFLWALAVAAGRSREREISHWELFLLESVAPKPVRAALLGAIGVELAIAAATCWITPALAFGVLVPVWGLGLSTLWGARHGAFYRRPPPGEASPTGDGPKG